MIHPDEGFPIKFGKNRELPWPFYVAWHHGQEMFMPMREDNDGWDGGIYHNRYHARLALLHWIKAGQVPLPTSKPGDSK